MTTQPSRGLVGAPGALLHGFPASDDDRAVLVEAAARAPVDLPHAFFDELVAEMRSLWPEVARMREAMGAQRLADDARLLELTRAAAVAAWMLQEEFAFLGTFFAPDDAHAAAFRPAQALKVGTGAYQRRVTRLDVLREAYRRSPWVPGAETRARRLGEASVRLFRAITEAREGAAEPVPLGEARQRVDRAYAALRDSVLAQRRLEADVLTLRFPDLSPSWRRERLGWPP
ncbi:MAG: hypothetical protein HY904_11575 [Deltaproteobacteria bacterium]|nr:hypothetical protein [Deltaproteobacteria bacterium]